MSLSMCWQDEFGNQLTVPTQALEYKIQLNKPVF